MRAARLHGNRDLRVDEVQRPGDLNAGEIRVAPYWCGICGTDLHEYQHGPLYTPQENLPQMLGHEFSGVVLETAPGVTNVRVGDRVSVLPHVFCGTCYFCVRGRQGLCSSLRITGLNWPWGGLAEETVVPGYQAIPLPDGVSFEQGAILEPLATVVHGIERSGLRPGGSVLITGAGPIGQLAILVAAAAGAGSIYIVEPHRARRELAAALGVTRAFDPTETDVAGEIAELTHGLGVDCAIECSGSQPGLDTTIAVTRRAGTVAVVALHAGPRSIVPDDLVWRDLTVAGIWSFKFYDTPAILASMAAGILPVERIITSTIDLGDVVAGGIERLGDPQGDEVKILVSPAGLA